jgi:hypothetical protein
MADTVIMRLKDENKRSFETRDQAMELHQETLEKL